MQIPQKETQPLNPLAYICGITKHVGNAIPTSITVDWEGYIFEGNRELDISTCVYTVEASYAGFKVSLQFDGTCFRIDSHNFDFPSHELTGGTPILVGIRIRAATERWMKEATSKAKRTADIFMGAFNEQLPG